MRAEIPGLCRLTACLSLSLSLSLSLALSLAVAGCTQQGDEVVGDNPDLATPLPPDAAQASDLAMRPPPPPVDLATDGPSGALPISAPPKTWTWIDFPDAVCDDGTPTGIGVNLVPGSQDVLLFLMGGGACWDYQSCAVSNTSTHGPYGSAQFDKTKGLFGLGSILDRNAKMPFRDYNMIYVPYCTGDVHVGDNVVTYDNGAGATRVIHHKGRPNLEAFLKRVLATVPTPGTVVVSGSSAGGFGAALNYDLVRGTFPHAKAYLIDDSGPPLVGDAIPKDLRDAWYKAWHLDKTLAPLCPNCQSDFSTLVPILAAKYPQDRMALLSNNQDGVIRGFFGNQSAMQFETNLYTMASTVIDPHANFHYYFVAGTGHTFLFAPGLSSVKGVSLLSWLTQMGTDDPKWTSVKP